MLILNRRPGEAVLIDGGIRIVVLSSDRQGVRIGIEAPSDINIQREELRTRAGASHPDADPAPAGGI
jgi:carbon storage regulator